MSDRWAFLAERDENFTFTVPWSIYFLARNLDVHVTLLSGVKFTGRICNYHYETITLRANAWTGRKWTGENSSTFNDISIRLGKVRDITILSDAKDVTKDEAVIRNALTLISIAKKEMLSAVSQKHFINVFSSLLKDKNHPDARKVIDWIDRNFAS